MDLLIKGGKVVTAKSTFKADVAVKNGKISAIGTNLKPEPGTEVVDAKGKLVLPGAIDGHTHMAMPFGGTISTDDYFTGTRAAACGMSLSDVKIFAFLMILSAFIATPLINLSDHRNIVISAYLQV